MLKTFNCGVGFCIIVNPKNLQKIKKFFSKKYEPYIIGKISKNYKNRFHHWIYDDELGILIILDHQLSFLILLD